jgi:hypothetical protein
MRILLVSAVLLWASAGQRGPGLFAQAAGLGGDRPPGQVFLGAMGGEDEEEERFRGEGAAARGEYEYAFDDGGDDDDYDDAQLDDDLYETV